MTGHTHLSAVLTACAHAPGFHDALTQLMLSALQDTMPDADWQLAATGRLEALADPGVASYGAAGVNRLRLLISPLSPLRGCLCPDHLCRKHDMDLSDPWVAAEEIINAIIVWCAADVKDDADTLESARGHRLFKLIRNAQPGQRRILMDTSAMIISIGLRFAQEMKERQAKMEREGVEPSTAAPAGLQPAPLDHSGISPADEAHATGAAPR